MNTVEKMLVDETITVLEAMQRLDETAAEILFVERGGRFVATLTDGDIRRWILKGGKLEASVDHVSNYSPKYLYECDRKMAVSFMEEHSLYALPILNSDPGSYHGGWEGHPALSVYKNFAKAADSHRRYSDRRAYYKLFL